MKIYFIISLVVLGFFLISGIQNLSKNNADGDFELVRHSDNDGLFNPVKNYFLMNKKNGDVYYYQNARWEKL